jgi:hypothetical protein
VLLEEVGRRIEERGAVYHRISVSGSKTDGHGREILGPIGELAEFDGRVETERAICPANREKQTMFVDDVEVLDQPDRLSLTTQVWL